MKSTAIYFALLAGAVTAKPVNLPTHSAPSTADYRFRCGGDFDCPLNQRCGYEVTFNGELLSSECIPAVCTPFLYLGNPDLKPLDFC